MTTTTLPVYALTPHPLVYVEAGTAHRQNGAMTPCYLGPVGRGLREVGALAPDTQWCWSCYPRRCRCGTPSDICVRPECLAADLDVDKRIELAS